MKNERLIKLLDFLDKEPNDPFLLYAVANITGGAVTQLFSLRIVSMLEMIVPKSSS